MSDTRAADLRLAGLSIWVDGWQYPHASNDSDADWLMVRAKCEAAFTLPSHCGRGSVAVAGSILGVSDLSRFHTQVETLHDNLAGSATLASYEPNLQVAVKASDSMGHCALVVDITPDHLTQTHQFRFAIDQSFLAIWLQQSRVLLERYPVRRATSPG